MATKAMEPVTTRLYERASEADRQREQRVSPGVPYRVAAEKMSGRLGLRLSDQQLDRAGLVLHYGLGVGWAPLYVLLRRWWRMPAPKAAIVTGLALFAIVDEGLNPIIGSSAPPQAYPLSTHVRGLVGHLAYAGWRWRPPSRPASCCLVAGRGADRDPADTGPLTSDALAGR